MVICLHVCCFVGGVAFPPAHPPELFPPLAPPGRWQCCQFSFLFVRGFMLIASCRLLVPLHVLHVLVVLSDSVKSGQHLGS